MAEQNWTNPQTDAITAKGGSVLVSAAAGSGKTAVLVERVIRLICDADRPVDADRLLVVTFSRAAAAEMKQRMGERIAHMIRAHPENLYLQKQQTLLEKANICTVDSFCLNLVRQNFESLNILPDFSLMDENERRLLEQDCLESCIAWFYESAQSTALAELVEQVSSSKDDGKLSETILNIYKFGLSHPFFDDWMQTMEAFYATDKPVAQTIWGELILQHAQDSVQYAIHLYATALELVQEDAAIQKAYQAALVSDADQLHALQPLLQQPNWDAAVRALQLFSFDRLKAAKGDEALKERIKAIRATVKSTIKTLSEQLMNATQADYQEDMRDLLPKVQLLFAMVRDFENRLQLLKRQKNRFDFADIAHFALQLLVEKLPEGFQPTPQAVQLAQQYDYILVDEYQDTNAVQEMIFTCISKQQRNLFMVGDVKQSIYRFRQAMPKIFMQKKEVFFPYASGMYPAKIMLDTNFRSRKQVTDAVNTIFGCLMSKACGEIDYNDEESLKCGASYQAYAQAMPELLLVDMQDCDTADTMEQEAAQIAQKINALLSNGYLVEEKGVRRPAIYKDFCILMRSVKTQASRYAQVLQKHGIPAMSETSGSYLATREISAVVSLLCALDNPMLDIELVGAMLSPLFHFTDDDIARIRLIAPKTPFFHALHTAREQGDAKAAAFLTQFFDLRLHAAALPADQLIMRLYEQTDALAVFQAMPMGDTRRANLLLLIEYAAGCHQLGYQQLGGFVRYLGRLAKQKEDFSPAAGLNDAANAVRIMSIHRSKGLEFPVVFLSNTAKQFNMADLRNNILLHSELGFACKRREEETYKQYDTIPMQAIRLAIQQSSLSEEMRILYVALTRAKEKLIVTGVVKKDLKKHLASRACDLSAKQKLPAYQVKKCHSYLDWILMVLLHVPSCTALREQADLAEMDLLQTASEWQVTIVQPCETESPEEVCAPERTLPPVDETLLTQLAKQASWIYPYAAETRIPAKLAISDVAKGEQDVSRHFQMRPKFLTDQKLTPTERGNAMHKFMQFANYEQARSHLAQEITRMEAEHFLSPTECAALNRDKLQAFFDSDLANRIFHSEKLYRELRFMAECGKELLQDMVEQIGDSKLILQGVADCVFIENGSAVIVDYKTDRLPADTLHQRYARQLHLYRIILQDRLQIPVAACILYSFHLNQQVIVQQK